MTTDSKGSTGMAGPPVESKNNDTDVASETSALDPLCGGGGIHQQIGDFWVTYPRLRRIERKIEECRLWSQGVTDPHCMLIMGDSGVGKSSIIRRILKRHPPKELPEGRHIPVLVVTMPVPATIKFMATRILAQLGDPAATKGTLEDKTHRIYRYLKDCKVELIILDEFQHMIDRDSDKILQSVSDWLKNIISDAMLPVILVGLPSSVRILKSNPQLNRRFTAQETLEPFKWDTKKHKQDYKKFLAALDAELPFQERSGLDTQEMAQRMFAATYGNVGTTMKIVRDAAHQAAADKNATHTKLTVEMLAKAYKYRVLNRRKGPDPFSGPLPAIRMTPLADAVAGKYQGEIEEEPLPRKTAPRTDKHPSASEIIRAQP